MSEISSLVQAKEPKPIVVYLASTRVLESLVPEAWKHVTTNANVRAFNERAQLLCKVFGFHFLDLYALSQIVPDSFFKDPVHIAKKDWAFYHYVSHLIWQTYELLLK